MANNYIKINTFNINKKLRNEEQRKTLMQDMTKRNIDICCFQETYCDKRTYTTHGDKLYCLRQRVGDTYTRYGQAFYVSNKWAQKNHTIIEINGRISIIIFDVEETIRNAGNRRNITKELVIINAYCPHSGHGEEKVHEFYQQLSDCTETYQIANNLVIVVGDFNSKLGTKQDGDTHIGNFGLGNENSNGEYLKQYMIDYNLIASNTFFQHKLNHRYTFKGNLENGAKTMIDYILINPILTKNKIVRNSRSYRGTNYESDHNLVIMKLNWNNKLFKKWNHKRQTRAISEKLDLYEFANNDNLKLRYSEIITQYLSDTTPNESINIRNNDLTIKIIQTATDIIPKKQKNEKISNMLFNDPILNNLSLEIAEINRQIRKLDNRINKIQEIRAYKNDKIIIRKHLKSRRKTVNNKYFSDIAAKIEINKGNKRSFEAAKSLRKFDHQEFSIKDENQNEMGENAIINNVTIHFQNFFNKLTDNTNAEPISQWVGEPHALEDPITLEEITKAIMKLNNGKSSGFDNIHAEFIKYGGIKLHQHIVDLFNNMFANRESLDMINIGILKPLNKPKKSKIITNVRPITLLNTIRKILSNVLLERIDDKLDSFISVDQSGFRRKRGTTDIVWTYRWMCAMVQVFQTEFHVMGIDISKAFDSVNRAKLMEAIKPLISESEFDILSFLLSNTSLYTKHNKKFGKRFYTTLGIPQGDALSPILFIFYLEVAL